MEDVVGNPVARPAHAGAGKASRERAYVVWIGCGGCDGCTMSVLGAVSPTLEELLTGDLTDIPRIELIHPVLSLESGSGYVGQLDEAARGRLDPFLLVVEGASSTSASRATVASPASVSARANRSRQRSGS